MPEHILIILESTALIWGGALLFSLSLFALLAILPDLHLQDWFGE